MLYFSDKNIKWATNVGNVLFPFPEAEHISCKSWIATFHNSRQVGSPQKSKSNPFLRFGLLRQTNQKHPGNKASYVLIPLLKPKPSVFSLYSNQRNKWCAYISVNKSYSALSRNHKFLGKHFYLAKYLESPFSKKWWFLVNSYIMSDTPELPDIIGEKNDSE